MSDGAGADAAEAGEKGGDVGNAPAAAAAAAVPPSVVATGAVDTDVDAAGNGVITNAPARSWTPKSVDSLERGAPYGTVSDGDDVSDGGGDDGSVSRGAPSTDGGDAGVAAGQGNSDTAAENAGDDAMSQDSLDDGSAAPTGPTVYGDASVDELMAATDRALAELKAAEDLASQTQPSPAAAAPAAVAPAAAPAPAPARVTVGTTRTRVASSTPGGSPRTPLRARKSTGTRRSAAGSGSGVSSPAKPPPAPRTVTPGKATAAAPTPPAGARAGQPAHAGAGGASNGDNNNNEQNSGDGGDEANDGGYSSDDSVRRARGRPADEAHIMSLYTNAAVVARKKEALHEKYFAAAHPFKPTINRLSQRLGAMPDADGQGTASPAARAAALYAEAAEREARAQAAVEAHIKKVAPFRPRITPSPGGVMSAEGSVSSFMSGGVHDRLYAAADELASRQKERAEAQRALDEQECTFHPVVRLPPGFQGRKEELYPGQQKLIERREEREKKARELEMRECTFAPKVSASPGGGGRPSDDGPVHDRLYTDHKRKQEDKAHKAQQRLAEEMAECTFRPRLSPAARRTRVAPESGEMWHDRMYQEAKVRQQKLQAARDAAQRAACPFVPRVSPHASSMVRVSQTSRFEEMYEEGKQKERATRKWRPPDTNDDVWSRGLRDTGPPPGAKPVPRSPSTSSIGSSASGAEAVTTPQSGARRRSSGGSAGSARGRRPPRSRAPASPLGSHSAKRALIRKQKSMASMGGAAASVASPRGGSAASVASAGDDGSSGGGQGVAATLVTGETAAEHVVRWSSMLRGNQETPGILSARARRSHGSELRGIVDKAMASPRRASSPELGVAARAMAQGADNNGAGDAGGDSRSGAPRRRRQSEDGSAAASRASAVHERLYKQGLARVQQQNAHTPPHLGMRWTGQLRRAGSTSSNAAGDAASGDANSTASGEAGGATAAMNAAAGAAAAMRAALVGSRLHAASTKASNARATSPTLMSRTNSWADSLRPPNEAEAQPRVFTGPDVSPAHERLYNTGRRASSGPNQQSRIPGPKSSGGGARHNTRRRSLTMRPGGGTSTIAKLGAGQKRTVIRRRKPAAAAAAATAAGAGAGEGHGDNDAGAVKPEVTAAAAPSSAGGAAAAAAPVVGAPAPTTGSSTTAAATPGGGDAADPQKEARKQKLANLLERRNSQTQEGAEGLLQSLQALHNQQASSAGGGDASGGANAGPNPEEDDGAEMLV